MKTCEPGVPGRMTALRLMVALGLLVPLPGQSQAVQHPVKSRSTALWYGVGGAVIPAVVGFQLMSTGAMHPSETALVVGAVYAGPMLGHLYARNPGRAFRGMAVRGGILVAATLAFTQTGICLERCDPGEETDEVVVGVAGVVATLASVVVDVLAAPRSVDRYTRTHQRVALVPLVGSDELSVGVTLRVAF